ncbi:MAG: metal ABC transporter permease [Pseudomonadota bacterium]
MLDDFLWRATFAGFGVALATGPLGCFVVWRRMAYFGDATAHAAILGVALSIAFSLPIMIGVIAICLVVAISVAQLSERVIAADTLLGVLSHGGLALGLVIVSVLASRNLDVEALLFGEILAVNRQDLLTIWIGSAIVIGILVWRWSGLLASTLNPDLAFASGVNPWRERLILALMLALVVGIALKVLGALLITAMLILPAAAARPLVQTPEKMAVLAAFLGCIAAVGGLRVSYLADTPSAPTIVCCALVIFLLTSLARLARDRLQK